jgi:hypothetical protein
LFDTGAGGAVVAGGAVPGGGSDVVGESHETHGDKVGGGAVSDGELELVAVVTRVVLDSDSDDTVEPDRVLVATPRALAPAPQPATANDPTAIPTTTDRAHRDRRTPGRPLTTTSTHQPV